MRSTSYIMEVVGGNKKSKNCIPHSTMFTLLITNDNNTGDEVLLLRTYVATVTFWHIFCTNKKLEKEN